MYCFVKQQLKPQALQAAVGKKQHPFGLGDFQAKISLEKKQPYHYLLDQERKHNEVENCK